MAPLTKKDLGHLFPAFLADFPWNRSMNASYVWDMLLRLPLEVWHLPIPHVHLEAVRLVLNLHMSKLLVNGCGCADLTSMFLACTSMACICAHQQGGEQSTG